MIRSQTIPNVHDSQPSALSQSKIGNFQGCKHIGEHNNPIIEQLSNYPNFIGQSLTHDCTKYAFGNVILTVVQSSFTLVKVRSIISSG